MTTFTINEQNEIVAFANQEQAAATTATPFDSFTSQQELAELAATWPPERLVAIWNSLTGVKPVKKFKDGQVAYARIWDRLQGLGESAEPKPERPEKAKAEKKAKDRAQAAKGVPTKGKATKKTTPAKAAPKAKKAAKAREAGAPRAGSKAATVVAMLQRKGGTTLKELQKALGGWMPHSIRGYLSGTLRKKMGLNIESVKPEDGGERTYRIK